MVIEVPGCKFRIGGSGIDWQVQYPWNGKDGGTQWKGKYFFPSLEFAVAKAYELALMDKADTVDMAEVPAECRRVKDELVAEVRKAVR